MENDADKFLSRAQEKMVLSVAAAVARTQYPNADRIACPELSVLKELATRRRALADSAAEIEHIGACSPCFIDYTRFRVAHKRRVRTGFAVAACVVVAAILTALPRILHQVFPAPSTISEVAVNRKPPEFETPITLDLRGRGPQRGTDEALTHSTQPLQLPRRRLSLSIYLPMGSEEGMYEVRLDNAAGESVVGATGTAIFERPVVVLHLSVDLSNAAPGVYQLRLRQPQKSWRTDTVTII